MEWRPHVWSITERKNGNLLVATVGDGIYTVDKQTKEVSRFQTKTNTLNSLTDENITIVFADNSDRIWIGSLDSGLDMVDESNNYNEYFKHNPLDSFSISNDEIRTIFQDRSGDIWIGTEGGGLNRWLGKGRFEHIDKEDGLIANSVMGITEDDNGLIWITTFKGISRLDKKTKAIKNFNFRTSQNANQFNQNAILTDSNGKLYFGGVNGLHAIEPESVIENNLQTELLFTDLKIYGESVPVGKLEDGRTILRKNIESSSDIWLSYLDQSFTIYFNAIDYTNPLENEFAFQMEGFNENWVYISAGQRSATYTNLDAGTYVFKIKHKEKIASIRIHIKPPFWKTTWFRIFAFLFSLGLIFSGLYFWIKRREAADKRKILQLQNEKLATEVETKNSKLMFSSVQMAHKNEILTEVKKDLIDLQKTPEKDTRSLVRKLDSELKNEDYWKEFNLYFNEVDQKFIDKIIEKYPELTKNDLRLCSLLRMNLSTKEIASLLNISTRAVEQSRYRLKKRLKLDKSEDLSKFITSFNSEINS
jgi:streptogramin lyase/DNA-binding CsgD family transcriptional regulator